MILALLLSCSSPTPAPVAAPTPPSEPPPAAPRALRVALNWYPEPEFGGFYDAVLTGKYKAKGIDVTLIPGGPGAPVLEQLGASQVDVALSEAADLLVRRAKGLDAVAIFPGFQDSPVGFMVHANGPTKLEEIKGRVAIEQGSPFQLFLSKKYGWDGKVELVPSSGSIGAFAADPTLVQQAYITSEPCQASAQNIESRFLPGRDAGWNPYASLAIVRAADVDQRWVRDFRDASMEGWKSYLADPSVANAEIIKLNPNMSASFMDCVVERQKPFVTGTDGLGVMTEARWKEIADALASTGSEIKLDGAWRQLL